jgi:hypothetical protein
LGPDGRPGRCAIRLNGSGSYLSVGNESNFDFTNAMTVACWIRPDTFDATWQAIVCKGDYSWRLHRYSDTNFVNFACSGLSQLDVTGGTNVNDGQWHHVAGVYDGATLYIYVDGNLDGSIASTGQIANTGDAVHIGSNASMAGREFKGLIDDVCIYNRALNAEEIGSLYTATATRTDLRSQMLGINATLWTRFTFTGQDLTPFDRMTLHMKYEDGFAAFLNGTPLVASNAPSPLAWNSAALSDRPDENAGVFQEFDVTSAMNLIQPAQTFWRPGFERFGLRHGFHASSRTAGLERGRSRTILHLPLAQRGQYRRRSAGVGRGPRIQS